MDHIQEMKITNSVLLSLFMASNEICNTSRVPPSTGLSRTLFSNDMQETWKFLENRVFQQLQQLKMCIRGDN